MTIHVSSDYTLSEREAAIATIEEFQGVNRFTDECVLGLVRSRLKHHSFTTEALVLMADEYERRARFSDRIKQNNRRLYTQPRSVR